MPPTDDRGQNYKVAYVVTVLSALGVVIGVYTLLGGNGQTQALVGGTLAGIAWYYVGGSMIMSLLRDEKPTLGDL